MTGMQLALFPAHAVNGAAPDWIEADDYTGRHSTARLKGTRVESWKASALAERAREGVVFASFGHVRGREMFSRNRYVADRTGAIHLYAADGAKVIVHPASRPLRILVKA